MSFGAGYAYPGPGSTPAALALGAVLLFAGAYCVYARSRATYATSAAREEPWAARQALVERKLYAAASYRAVRGHADPVDYLSAAASGGLIQAAT